MCVKGLSAYMCVCVCVRERERVCCLCMLPVGSSGGNKSEFECASLQPVRWQCQMPEGDWPLLALFSVWV